MCVSAVTEELIAKGSIVSTVENGTIHVVIKDEDERLVSETNYVYSEKSDKNGTHSTLSFHRLYRGRLMNMGLELEWEYGYSSVKVSAKNLGQLTKTEVATILNTIAWSGTFVPTTSTEDEWGNIETLDFDTEDHIAQVEAEERRSAKAKDMANTLIG